MDLGFDMRSSVGRAAQFHGEQRRCDQRATALGPASQATPQRTDPTIRAVVPRSTQPG